MTRGSMHVTVILYYVNINRNIVFSIHPLLSPSPFQYQISLWVANGASSASGDLIPNALKISWADASASSPPTTPGNLIQVVMNEQTRPVRLQFFSWTHFAILTVRD